MAMTPALSAETDQAIAATTVVVNSLVDFMRTLIENGKDPSEAVLTAACQVRDKYMNAKIQNQLDAIDALAGTLAVAVTIILKSERGQ
jgi:hypothetical protein